MFARIASALKRAFAKLKAGVAATLGYFDDVFDDVFSTIGDGFDWCQERVHRTLRLLPFFGEGGSGMSGPAMPRPQLDLPSPRLAAAAEPKMPAASSPGAVIAQYLGTDIKERYRVDTSALDPEIVSWLENLTDDEEEVIKALSPRTLEQIAGGQALPPDDIQGPYIDKIEPKLDRDQQIRKSMRLKMRNPDRSGLEYEMRI